MGDAKRRRAPGRWRCSPAALGIVAALISLPVRAQSPHELAGLREEAAQLRQSLERLDARIQVLETQSDGHPAGKSSADSAKGLPASKTESVPASRTASIDVSSLVTMKQNWAQVEAGTPEDKVQALLGKPEKMLRIDGNLVWYYVYPGIGRGSVFFNRNGTVSSTQAPALGWAR